MEMLDSDWGDLLFSNKLLIQITHSPDVGHLI